MEITLHLDNILDLLTSVYFHKNVKNSKRNEQVVNYEDEDTSDFPQTILQSNIEKRYLLEDLTKEESNCYFCVNDSKYWCTFNDTTQLQKGRGFLCWHDCHVFNTVPIGCPLKRLENGKFLTTGVFCSFPCIKKFLKRRLNKAKYKDSQTLLTLLYLILNGEIGEIPLAPSRKQLKKFGGHLTIKEFRASFGKLEYISHNNNLCIPTPEAIQEKVIKRKEKEN
jgi:hypothetical protein